MSRSANTTKWICQLAMVRSMLIVPHDKLRALDAQHQLTVYYRNILRELAAVFTPFESVTHCIRGDRVVIGSMIVPRVRINIG